MSETRAPAPPSPSADGPQPPPAIPDVLAGDWSEGLAGPARPHGIAAPRPISFTPNGASEPVHEEVSWEPAPDPLQESPPDPPQDSSEPLQGSAADGVAEPAPELPAESGPTPWSEPVPENTSQFAAPADGADGTTEAWQMPAPAPGETPPPEQPVAQATEPEAPSPDDAWNVAPEQPVEEWQPEAPPADFQEPRQPEAAPALESAPADWSTLRSGPDWDAAPAADPTGGAWDAAPPPPQESQWAAEPTAQSTDTEWSAPASEAHWSAPAAPAAEEWEAAVAGAQPVSDPEVAAPAAPVPAWNSPAVGASALEQLDSEPMSAVPGAAKELFGSVPTGGMLAGNDDDAGEPEELASPEEVLRPVAIDHDDPDLPEPTGEPARTRAQPLAAFRPTAMNAMAVDGEHRVAVHTRGGRTLRGSMRDVDLSKSQFPLVPQGGGEPESIYRADLKAIFFMLAPGEPPHAGDGGKVKVTFSDGRVIEGIRDGADAKHGFFLVPLDAARTNTRRIYVAREATSEIKEG